MGMPASSFTGNIRFFEALPPLEPDTDPEPAFVPETAEA